MNRSPSIMAMCDSVLDIVGSLRKEYLCQTASVREQIPEQNFGYDADRDLLLTESFGEFTRKKEKKDEK